MHMMEGLKGEKSRELAIYDLGSTPSHRYRDHPADDRFMKRSVQSGKPFYAYVPFTQVHFPTLPHPKFAGKTGFGDFPDILAEMDEHAGEIPDGHKLLTVAYVHKNISDCGLLRWQKDRCARRGEGNFAA